MEKREILSLLEEGGGITLGHFARNREWHADLQVGKYLGFHNPEATEKLCAKLLKSFDGKSFDIIVVRSVAEDLILGYACGRALNLKVLAVFKDEGLVSLVPQYNIQAGSKALVVANSFRTEDSLRATIAALTSRCVELGGIAVLVDEGIGTWYAKAEVSRLVSLEDHIYRADSCPLCLKDVPLRGGVLV